MAEKGSPKASFIEIKKFGLGDIDHGYRASLDCRSA